MRIGRHEGEPFGRIGRIERQVRCAGLEDREQRDDRFDRSFERDAHHRAPHHTARGQPPRERVRAHVQFAVRQRAGRARHRERAGIVLRPACEGTVRGIARIGRGRRVPSVDELRAFGRIEQVERERPRVRIGCDRVE